MGKKFLKLLATGGKDNARLSLWGNEINNSKGHSEKEKHEHIFEVRYDAPDRSKNKISQWPAKKSALDYADAEIEVHQMKKEN